jgi:hypothetical protein
MTDRNRKQIVVDYNAAFTSLFSNQLFNPYIFFFFELPVRTGASCQESQKSSTIFRSRELARRLPVEPFMPFHLT